MEHDRDFISKMLSEALTKKKLIEERKAAKKAAKKAAYEAEKEVKKKVFKNKLSKFMSIVCESNNILSSISGEILSFASKGKMIFSNGENADDSFFDFANLYWRDERVSKGPIKNWLGFEMKEEFARQGLEIIGEPIYDEMCIEHLPNNESLFHYANRACQNTHPVKDLGSGYSKVPCGSIVLHFPESNFHSEAEYWYGSEHHPRDCAQIMWPPRPNWKLYIGEIVTEQPMSYYSERFEITDHIPPEFKKFDDMRKTDEYWNAKGGYHFPAIKWYKTVYCSKNRYECEAKGGCGKDIRAIEWEETEDSSYLVFSVGCMSKKVERMVLDWKLSE